MRCVTEPPAGGGENTEQSAPYSPVVHLSANICGQGQVLCGLNIRGASRVVNVGVVLAVRVVGGVWVVGCGCVLIVEVCGRRKQSEGDTA
jgi:hypothetical protein